jgi:hypothetical protein
MTPKWTGSATLGSQVVLEDGTTFTIGAVPARRRRVTLIARLRCWWRGGHEDRLQWSCDPPALWLWCAECGRVTPGWRVSARTHRRPYTQLDPG